MKKKDSFLVIVVMICCIMMIGCGSKSDSKNSGDTAMSQDKGEVTEAVSPTSTGEVTEAVSPTSAGEVTTAEGQTEAEGQTGTEEDTTVLTTNDEKEEDIIIKTGTIQTIKINSESIKQNLIGDSGERTIYIYLPEAYSNEGAPMPVVYFLHGLDDSSFSFIYQTKQELDHAFDGSVREFIVVALDGNNSTSGSFYVNSPSSGNWEDFITKEVVEYIDSNYNTIADSAARCITGYSMGGFGAINIALNHSDIFSSVLTFCPGVYADGQIKKMWDSWSGWNEVKRSYAQAFSPNEDSTRYFGNIPTFSGTEEDNAILAEWDRGYGCWEEKVDTYVKDGAGLNGIQIVYGKSDNFKWIPEGCVFLADTFQDKGVECELTEFQGGHSVPYNSFVTYFIPFTEKYLKFD